MILKDTRIEIANRHTSLYYLADPTPPSGPLPFGDKAAYIAFYNSLESGSKVTYTSATGRPTAAILGALGPVYHDNKFWRFVLQNKPQARLAWSNLLPVSCSLTTQIAITAPVGLSARILLRPQVLLFPFGWSTWLSLRVLGEHSLQQLSELVDVLFNGPAWDLGSKKSVRVQDLFDTVAESVRLDAFAGEDNEDTEVPDKLLVTTVLEKSQGSPSLQGVGTEDEVSLKRLLNPTGKPSQKTLSDLAVALHKDKNIDYILCGDLSRFIWMDHLLSRADPSESQNYGKLNCYHNNSFMAPLQAWQMTGMVNMAASIIKPPERLANLVSMAKKKLEAPPPHTREAYINASLRAFYELTQQNQ